MKQLKFYHRRLCISSLIRLAKGVFQTAPVVSNIDFAACMARTARACFTAKIMMHLSVPRAGRCPPLGIVCWPVSGLSSPLCRALLCGALIMLCAVHPTRAIAAQDSVAVVISDFDNFDTSGESANRTAEHAARVQAFAALLRDDLAAQNKFKIVQLTCQHPPCSAARMSPNDLVRAARQAGARLLVYGGIHKESTLIQWGKIEVFDLKKHELVLNKNFSFRGDTDQAFRRAAAFLARYFETLHP